MRLGDKVQVQTQMYPVVNMPGTLVELNANSVVVRLDNGTRHECSAIYVKPIGSPDNIARCQTCYTDATWIDYGNGVGKGWYCRSCKEEVSSSDNSYGISGKAQATKKIVTHSVASYAPLMCMKQQCGVCHGTKTAIQEPYGVQVYGANVRCVVDDGSSGKLHARNIYKVDALDVNGNLILQGLGIVAYSRCRFEIEVPSTPFQPTVYNSTLNLYP